VGCSTDAEAWAASTGQEGLRDAALPWQDAGCRSGSTVSLQFLVDGEVLIDQITRAAQDVSDLLGRHVLLPAVADAIELSEVAIDGLQTVVGFAGDLLGGLAFEAFPADEALVSEAGAQLM